MRVSRLLSCVACLFALATAVGCGSSGNNGGTAAIAGAGAGTGVMNTGAGGAYVSPTGSGGTGVVAGTGAGIGVVGGTGTAGGAGGAPGTGGTGPVAGAGTGGMGAGTGGMMAMNGDATTSTTKIEYNDPNMKCYEFRVHAQGDKTAPWTVPTTPDLYTEFYFAAPWTGTQYARSFRYLKGNEAVIHHYLFFREEGGADGEIKGQVLHAGGQLLQGWAPGGQDVYYSANLGQEMPVVTYLLESHHNNTTGAPAPDNTGMEVCVTTTKPEHVASISWLGTDAISGTQSAGICDPPDTQPIHVLGGTPHMHKKGIRQTVIINRAGGMKETLLDTPFDFANQTTYHTPTIINAGDTMTTTCYYSAPASFGEKTSDEMCYFFTLYYPSGSLESLGVGNLIHGPNVCGI